MDRKSKIFLALFSILIITSVAITYYRYIVLRDYIIEAQAVCDPYAEACFTHICDSAAGEECVGDIEKDTTYYKLIRRNAKNIPSCDPKTEGCNALTCPAGEADCTFILCDSAQVDDGDKCSI